MRPLALVVLVALAGCAAPAPAATTPSPAGGPLVLAMSGCDAFDGQFPIAPPEAQAVLPAGWSGGQAGFGEAWAWSCQASSLGNETLGGSSGMLLGATGTNGTTQLHFATLALDSSPDAAAWLARLGIGPARVGNASVVVPAPEGSVSASGAGARVELATAARESPFRETTDDTPFALLQAGKVVGVLNCHASTPPALLGAWHFTAFEGAGNFTAPQGGTGYTLAGGTIDCVAVLAAQP